jgi:hypoxanthine phosphoribosyltransferase
MENSMTINKVYYTDKTIKSWMHDIIQTMYADDFKPDYIVGITRGGLTPASMLSYYLRTPMVALDVSFREDSEVGQESNLWLAEEAFGYVSSIDQDGMEDPGDKPNYALNAKNILIVDDINDTGRTLQWIKDDWESGCLPTNERWEGVWHNNVRFAVMINNEASEFKNIDYAGLHINKLEEPIWCVFPWEEWWR